MTNPIMPGIEKLAEKYGINVNRKPEVISFNQLIKQTNDEFIIENINYFEKKISIALSKNYLDKGEKKLPLDWIIFPEKNKLVSEYYEIPSIPLYYSIMNLISSNSDKAFDPNVNDLVNEIRHDIFSNNIFFNTFINYHPNGSDMIYHEYKTMKEKRNIVFMSDTSEWLSHSYMLDKQIKFIFNAHTSSLLKTLHYFTSLIPKVITLPEKVTQHTILNVGMYYEVKSDELRIDFTQPLNIPKCARGYRILE